MPYTGKPSTGCKNCRISKKKCDEKRPACERCVRLGKACGGYRDWSEVMMRTETDRVIQRVTGTGRKGSSSSTPPPLTRQLSPTKEDQACKFFFDNFVTASHLSFLEGVAPNELLILPIMACATAGMANRSDDQQGREMARQHYIKALVATNDALRHPRKVKEDSTLVSVCLLSLFERIAWERRTSQISWRNHIEGSARVLELRGRSQIRTRTGAALFRELRNHIIVNSIQQESDAPDFILPWTQALDFDTYQTPIDQLAIIAVRIASFRAAFRKSSKPDNELIETGEILEKDLLAWSETTLAAGSVSSFYNIQDLDSAHAWDGTRHEYGIPQAYRPWNLWRSLRIILSRAQEAIWRRSWPILSDPQLKIRDSEHYRSIRNRMVSDICVAAAYAFGNDPSAEPARGSISAGHLMVDSLGLAATCLIEQLSEPTVTPGGSRMLITGTPFHLDPYNHASTQLAWILERVDYIAEKVGIRWAVAMGKFLRGDIRVHYDLGRSKPIKGEELEIMFVDEPNLPFNEPALAYTEPDLAFQPDLAFNDPELDFEDMLLLSEEEGSSSMALSADQTGPDSRHSSLS